MRRILVLLTVVALMVVMLAMTASSAMADRFPAPPSPGEPLLSGSGNPGATTVIHCGPFFEQVAGIEGGHGAAAFNKNGGVSGNCVLAPPQ